ncbi:MAG: methionine--tRNA ligase [Candidatus Jacksonbacteria bacterium]
MKYYLTTPIFYVNAKPHIGHAYTTLSADVIARYQKQKIGKQNVFFLTGTDEHGTKIAEAAEKAGKTSQNFCDTIAAEFKKTWANLNIKYNHFIRTTDDYHKQGAQGFLSALKKKGVIYKADYHGLYCTECENFITEKELDKKGRCPAHQKPPQKITEKNWFFKLKNYLPVIQKLIENDKLKIVPKNKKQEVLGLFKQGLDDFSVSRPNVKWGIPLPWDNNQTIYVWVEALLNYWTALRAYNPHMAKFWPPDLHLIGKDIIKFHCIYWPAMLLAYFDGDLSQFPNKIFVHGFFTINNQKMSKTLGNVIDPNNLIKEYGVDGARWLILSQFPFGADGDDIEEIKFKEKYNADLANGIGNLVARVTSLCLKQIMNWEGFWTKLKNYELPCHADMAWRIMNYENLMHDLKLYEALKIIMRQVKSTDEYLAKNTPWKLDKAKDQKKIIDILSHSCASILSIANMLKPFLPQTSQKIKQCIDIKNKKIKQIKALFPRK